MRVAWLNGRHIDKSFPDGIFYTILTNTYVWQNESNSWDLYVLLSIVIIAIFQVFA